MRKHLAPGETSYSTQNPKTPKPQNPCTIFYFEIKFINLINDMAQESHFMMKSNSDASNSDRKKNRQRDVSPEIERHALMSSKYSAEIRATFNMVESELIGRLDVAKTLFAK